MELYNNPRRIATMSFPESNHEYIPLAQFDNAYAGYYVYECYYDDCGCFRYDNVTHGKKQPLTVYTNIIQINKYIPSCFHCCIIYSYFSCRNI